MEAPLGKIASEDVRAASGTAVGHDHPSSPPIQLPDAKADFLQRQQKCAAEMIFVILGLRLAVEQEEVLKSIPKHRYIPGQDFPAVAGLGIGLGGVSGHGGRWYNRCWRGTREAIMSGG